MPTPSNKESSIFNFNAGPRRARIVKTSAGLLGITITGLLKDFIDSRLTGYLRSRGIEVVEDQPIRMKETR